MNARESSSVSAEFESADVSVIICAYTEKRWSDLVAAIASVRSQTIHPREIIVVIDHNPPLLQRVRDEIPDVIAVANAEERGLSGARNSGLAAAHGSIVAFLDDDAIAEPDWLERLVAVFDDPSVLVAGGAVNPEWQHHPPRWFPDEFHWVVGCTYRGMPTTKTQVRNPIGANMAFRRVVFEHIGTFRAGIGRVGTLPVGCEETELCIRYRQQLPHGRIVYEPLARVRHRVSPPRTTLRYFVARCFAEGCSKALVTRLVGRDDGLAAERAYTLRTLPSGVMRGVRDAVRGDAAGLARSAAIVAGLAMTTLGYAVGNAIGMNRKGGQVSSSTPSTRAQTVPALLKISQGQRFNQKGEAMRWIEFDIHGRASMRVDADAPTAPLLRDMFAPFLSNRPLSSFDLTITGKLQPVAGVSFGETEYHYTDHSLYFPEIDVQILLDEDGFHLNGTRELLVFALPLIDRIMVTRGAAMIHAATVEYRGTGLCLPAWGGTGKTSTIAKLLRRDGFAFMGDDWAFLTADGQLLGYQKPMFIKPHHRPIYPHLFQAKRKPLVPVRLSRPLGRLTTRVHPVVTQYPRFARFARQFSPEHMTVSPDQAFPHARMATEAPLGLAMFVERYDGSVVRLHERDESWMVSRLIGNFHAEITPHSQKVITAMAATGMVPIETTFGDKAAVLRSALAGKPALLLQIPQAWPPDQASDAIVAEVERMIDRYGLGRSADTRGEHEAPSHLAGTPVPHVAVSTR
jgi:GT2 family glycosyltransferase